MTQQYLTPDELFDFFMLEEAPYWVLQNARKSRETISSFKKRDRGELTADELLEQSWEQLYSYLFRHPGGLGKLILKASPSAQNTTSSTLYVKWGSELNNTTMVPSIGSVSGYPTTGGMDPMAAKLFAQQEKFFEQRLADQEKFMEMLFKVREQEAMIEGLSEPGLQETLIHSGMDLVKTYLTTSAIRPAAQLGTSGEWAEGHPPTPPPANPTPSARPISTDQARGDLLVLQEAIPGIHPNDALRALTLFAQQNPDMAHSYLLTLIEQVK